MMTIIDKTSLDQSFQMLIEYCDVSGQEGFFKRRQYPGANKIFCFQVPQIFLPCSAMYVFTDFFSTNKHTDTIIYLQCYVPLNMSRNGNQCEQFQTSQKLFQTNVFLKMNKILSQNVLRRKAPVASWG